LLTEPVLCCGSCFVYIANLAIELEAVDGF
jgi:hypothetical protein